MYELALWSHIITARISIFQADFIVMIFYVYPYSQKHMFTGGATVSGLSELDYPTVSSLSSLASVSQLHTLNKVPLPPEIMEHFGRILYTLVP